MEAFATYALDMLSTPGGGFTFFAGKLTSPHATNVLAASHFLAVRRNCRERRIWDDVPTRVRFYSHVLPVL